MNNFLCYTQIGDLLRKEVHHMYEIVTKILVPIFVGIVLKLVTIWLEKQNKE
ncbi:type I toxin-antitoxin system Fst family toxin [Enterococcus faecalis]|nr:type I toxin-antitoxin system Fst family toxin [Enterococcus faecalis]EGO8501476.1 type I toxin-antitoxin system Fst family toxin [Enterococcus faecalis]EGO8660717.1 type I toxin-antitoxin system Fst family toxin [Enterococcus faecalis]MBP1518391.1 type I toxin-antitoxin system Fst family toxin [Enterococcus faecalis]MBW3680778.1 type I toxin-antitoxin system Fst family toxin [Enterococcus faecalis]